jgi:undecaprenyl-diphosphatase
MVATAVGAAFGSITVFFLLAEDVADGGRLVSRDQAVLGWFIDHRTDASISIAKLISTLGSFTVLLILAAVLGVWLLARGWRSVLPIAPAAALALGGLASTIAKSHYGRDRPPISVHAVTVTLAAFPSGHATDAAAFFLAAASVLALTIARRRSMQVLLLAGGLVCAGLVGLSRLVLGVHWLSDVVAGWALGTTIATVIVITLWYAATRTTTTSRSGSQAQQTDSAKPISAAASTRSLSPRPRNGREYR